MGQAVDSRRRRRDRDKKMTDEIDPYFVMRKWISKKEFDVKLIDKHRMKELFTDIKNISIPKTYFTSNKKGEMNILNELPESGKVIIKHNSGSTFVRVIDVKDINQKFLKKLYWQWNTRALNYKINSSEVMYKWVEPLIFAEEFIGDGDDITDMVDYKVHFFNKDQFLFFIAKNRRTPEFFKAEFDKNFAEKVYAKSKVNEKENRVLTENEKEIFKKLLVVTKDISKKIPHYFRADFYYVNKQIYLGEITLLHDGGRIFKFLNEEHNWWNKNYKLANKIS